MGHQSESLISQLNEASLSNISKIESLFFKNKKEYRCSIKVKLSQFRDVSDIDMSNCEIEDSDMPNLVLLIKSNTSLLFLDLTSNNITSKGAKILAQVIKQNNHLREVILVDNPIDSEGITELTEAIKRNYTIKTLAISGANNCIQALLIENCYFEEDAKLRSEKYRLKDQIIENVKKKELKLKETDNSVPFKKVFDSLSEYFTTKLNISNVNMDYGHYDIVCTNKLPIIGIGDVSSIYYNNDLN